VGVRRPCEEEEEEDDDDDEGPPPEPKRLEACLRAGMSEEPLFWLREFRDDEQTSAQTTWDAASAAQRRHAAAWIRAWSEETALGSLKDTMGSVDGTVCSVFTEDAQDWMRRWVASVLLDVFGDKEDLAASVEVVPGRPTPKFIAHTTDDVLTQFSQLAQYEDLWSGEGSRAEDLLDFLEPTATLAGATIEAVHEVLCRWIVATALAELLHARLKVAPSVEDDEATSKKKNGTSDTAMTPAPSAREALLKKAQSMRAGHRGSEDDDDEQDDDEWSESEDVPDVPVPPPRPVSMPVEPVASKPPPTPEPTKQPTAPGGRKPLPPRPKSSAGTTARPKTAVGAYYSENAVHRSRHEKGYDVLDREMAKLATEKKQRHNDEDASGDPGSSSSKDHARRARELLVEHVAAMVSTGL